MKRRPKFSTGDLVKFGHYDGHNITHHYGRIIGIDYIVNRFEYEILDNTGECYKHIEEKFVYALAETNKVKVAFEINSIDMQCFKMEHCRKTDVPSEYIYTKRDLRHDNAEIINVSFEEAENSYEVLDRLSHYWGGWNSTPQSWQMVKIAKSWNKKYGAELIKVSHDTLTFSCQQLTDKEIRELSSKATALSAEIEINADRTVFELWWD